MSEKSRSIFEDVSGPKQAAPGPALPEAGDEMGFRRQVARWLWGLFALVVLMILVGGMTRLTDSGLSITEWRPVTGAIPPLSAAGWESEFAKYKAIPEYQLQNAGMSLAEFKVIYWWEWGHRQLGRVIGLVWLAGFVWFLRSGNLARTWVARLGLLGGLGALQGAIGWWMVSSGLSGDAVDVASYRLATHLGLAFTILGLIAWYVRLLSRPEMSLFQARRRQVTDMVMPANLLLGFAFLQILLGALVAGIDAGRSFNDWPLMGGAIFPYDAFGLSPWISNFFENAGLTQFNHRLVGYVLLGLAVWVFLKARASGLVELRRRFLFAKIALWVQAIIGIITVLTEAPVHWGIIHQAGAVAVFVLVIWARFAVYYPAEQSIRG